MKTCKVCGVTKPLEHYHKAPGYLQGCKPQCKDCFLQIQKELRKKITPQTRRGYWVKHKYGITLEQQEHMLVTQGGVCALCKLPMERLCVDHSHATGAVRGLLCIPCNTGLGAFKDSTTTLLAAAAYVTSRF